MTKVINCDCGLTCSGETEEELLSAAERHIAADHPELAGTVSRDDLLAMAEER
jgi:predicted small metal-binding protein